MPLNGSIQGRVLLAASITMVAFLLLFSLALLESFSATQEQAILRRLAADANTLITAAREVDGVLVMPEQLADERFDLEESDLIGMVYSGEGELLWRSRSSADRLPDYGPIYRHDTLDFSRFTYQGADYFVYDLDLVLNPEDGNRGYSFITMGSAEEHDLVVTQFRRQLVFWSSASCVVLLLVLGVALHWSLRPLRSLRRELAAIEAGERETLSDRYPREVIRLTRGLNRMIRSERIQQQRYRALGADLAHSLKTPLANIHNSLQRLRGRTDLEPDVLMALDAQAQEMNQIVSFQLQRVVPSQSALAQERVAVAPLLKRLVDSLQKVYVDKQVLCDLRVDDALNFHGNRQVLLEVCGNLLDNAFRLCVRAVRISARFEAARGTHPRIEIRVEDDGPGVPEDQRGAILNRGVRADSRHPGQGIGLAVTRDIVSQYDGRIGIETSAMGGACFIVSLPQ